MANVGRLRIPCDMRVRMMPTAPQDRMGGDDYSGKNVDELVHASKLLTINDLDSAAARQHSNYVVMGIDPSN